jgi:hypothetical protein
MGKYIVRVTEKRVKEVVVDACAPSEARKRGLAKILESEGKATA